MRVYIFKIIISPRDMFWRQMGGHLRRVETCSSGVTWGIGYDHTAWVYTGGWGGAFLKGRILVNLSKVLQISYLFYHRF